MYNAPTRPAYRLECRNCPWVSTFFFDQELPAICPKCNRPRPKQTSLQTGEGYKHRKKR